MANMHLITGFAGEPHITAADFGAFWAAIIGSGDYVLDHGQKFAVTIVSNNQIRIADGELLMQGRHGRIKTGETVDLTIENGTADTQRRDLIVARYTKSEETGVEEINLIVILGTPVTSSPADPEYITGNILNGDLQRDFPLFRVNLNGATISGIDTLFTVIPCLTTNNSNLLFSVENRIAEMEERTSTKANLKVGKYTGTNKAGESSKNTLAFGFKPKAVIIFSDAPLLYNDPGECILFDVWNTAITEKLIQSDVHRHYTATATGISWYIDNTDVSNAIELQFNKNSITYCYIALG